MYGLKSARGPFTAADLPVDDTGRIYHLRIRPEDLAPDILLVGDPGRAEWIGSKHMCDIEVREEHRGLVTITGTSQIGGRRATIIGPLRSTVATSGMGASSLEIVLSELVALHEIDFVTRRGKASFPRLHVIRVGTSGALQASTSLGVSVITSYAVGMDNAGLFYEIPWPDATCRRLERELTRMVSRAICPGSRFTGGIRPYVARSEPRLVRALEDAALDYGIQSIKGLTVSNSGFFAAQGRDIARVSPSLPDLDRLFSHFDPEVDGQRVENMEMEAAFMLHFLGGLGHWAGAICPVIANRRLETFDQQYQAAVDGAVRVALRALSDLRQYREEIYCST